MRSVLLTLAALLCACGDTKSPPESVMPEPAPKLPPRAEAADALAVEVFRHVVAQEEGNIVFSPASLEGLLHLLLGGAGGTTRAELAALPYGKQGVPSAVQVRSANALFADEDVKLRPGVQNVQRAPMLRNPARAASRINTWCSEHTAGKIDSIIMESDVAEKRPRLLALNAVHLKAQWIEPFENSATHDGIFHAPGGPVTAPMMEQEEHLVYAEGADWQAVALFYRRDDRQGEPGCFIGILPKGNAREFAAKLTPQKWNSIRSALVKGGYRLVRVTLPRFEVRTDAFSLSSALQALGVRAAFTSAADFSGFAEGESLALSDVKQKCYIIVDEKGTEAAAVTMAALRAVPIVPTPPKPKVIRFDRPFLWVVGDLATSAPPFFMGVCERP